jgi:hypothetical protein
MKIILKLGDRKFPSILGIALVILAPLMIPGMITSEQSQQLMEHIIQFIGVILTAAGKSLLKS